MEDRTNFVPKHVGRNIFPANPFFNRLVRFAHAIPPRICVRDDNLGKEYNHLQLLTDALALRERIWNDFLTPEIRRQLERRQEVYIAILAPGEYEYTVAVIASLALGAAMVPMSVMLPPEEALYFATKSRAACVLCGSSAAQLGKDLTQLVRREDPSSTFTSVPIYP